MGIAGGVTQVQHLNRNIFWIASMRIDLAAVAALTKNGADVTPGSTFPESSFERLRSVAMAFVGELTGEADSAALHAAAVAYRDAIIAFTNDVNTATFATAEESFTQMRACVPVSY